MRHAGQMSQASDSPSPVAHVPITDRGFRHGLGVFETIKIHSGKALFAEWHRESLERSAKALNLPTPDGRVLEDSLSELKLEAGILRWFATGSGTYSLEAEDADPIPETMSLTTSPLFASSVAWNARFKTLSYLHHIQAREEVETDEALLINEKGEIATAAMGNIYWVRGGRIYTPAFECGCRKGVIRRWLLENGAWPVLLGNYKAEVLENADEIFITNSRIGIIPVTAFDGRAIEAGEVCQDLQRLYLTCLKEQLA